MAFGEVTEHNVYLCTGQPLPTDIAKIVEWMLNENFSTAYESKSVSKYNIYDSTDKPSMLHYRCVYFHCTMFSVDISHLKLMKGLALQDIITQIHTYVHRGM